MANRRMIYTPLTQSFQFFEQSAGAQALYLALVGAADDDGVVEGKLLLRTANRRKKELLELEANGYVVIIEQSTLLCWLVDWQSFNTIRTDRGQPSRYRSTLIKAVPNIENRLFKPKTGVICGQNDGVGDGMVGHVMVDQGESERPTPPTLNDIRAFCKKNNLYAVNPEKFFYHYQEHGWDKVESWHERLFKWNAEDAKKKKSTTQPKPTRFTNYPVDPKRMEKYDDPGLYG